MELKDDKKMQNKELILHKATTTLASIMVQPKSPTSTTWASCITIVYPHNNRCATNCEVVS
jgi:hypothetical protein